MRHGKTGRKLQKENRRYRISVITPCYNEELNVENCQKRLQAVMTTKLPEYEYEHIFADNSSTDETFTILNNLAKDDPRVKVIRNSRNVGPFRNMWNAMKSASGDVVIPLLPADLQDPPEVIPALVKGWEEGNLVVYGVRAKREEFLGMRVIRNVYYRMISRFSSAVIPRNSGEFLLADKRVIDSILALDDEYPYIRGRIAQTGVKSTSVPYTWVAREKGKSKNSYLDLIDQGMNGFISTSRVPARIALLLGFILSILGICLAFFTALSFLGNHSQVSKGTPTIIVVLFLFGGVQLFFTGLIGEYVLSIHSQVRKNPPIFEIDRVNF